MKNLFLIILVLISFNSWGQRLEKMNPKEFLETTGFHTNWTRIEIIGNDTIIPVPCGGMNPTVNIHKESSEYWMEIIYGQEIEEYKIRSVEIVDSLSVKFNIAENYSFSIEFKDSSFTLGHWYYKHSDPNDYLFLPNALIKHIEPEQVNCD